MGGLLWWKRLGGRHLAGDVEFVGKIEEYDDARAMDDQVFEVRDCLVRMDSQVPATQTCRFVLTDLLSKCSLLGSR